MTCPTPVARTPRSAASLISNACRADASTAPGRCLPGQSQRPTWPRGICPRPALGHFHSPGELGDLVSVWALLRGRASGCTSVKRRVGSGGEYRPTAAKAPALLPSLPGELEQPQGTPFSRMVLFSQTGLFPSQSRLTDSEGNVSQSR